MTTMREAIMAAAATAIDAATAADVAVYRNRTDGIARSEAKTVVVRPIADTPQFAGVGPIDSMLTFAVDVIVLADETTMQGTADDIAEAAYSALMVGIAGTMDVTPKAHTWDYSGGDVDAVILTMEFDAFYRHSWGSLTT